MLRTALPSLVVLTAAVASGCGGGDGPAPPARSAPEVVEIAMEEVRFLPERAAVRVGQTVRATSSRRGEPGRSGTSARSTRARPGSSS